MSFACLPCSFVSSKPSSMLHLDYDCDVPTGTLALITNMSTNGLVIVDCLQATLMYIAKHTHTHCQYCNTMAIGILTCNILQLLDNILPASQYQRDDKNTFLYILTINYAASCFPDSIANVLHFYPCLVLREKTIWGSHAKMLCGKSNSLS